MGIMPRDQTEKESLENILSILIFLVSTQAQKIGNFLYTSSMLI